MWWGASQYLCIVDSKTIRPARRVERHLPVHTASLASERGVTFDFTVALRPQGTIRDGEPKTATSNFTRLLNWEEWHWNQSFYLPVTALRRRPPPLPPPPSLPRRILNGRLHTVISVTDVRDVFAHVSLHRQRSIQQPPQLLRNGHSGHAHASGNAQITVENAFLMDISSLAPPPPPPRPFVSRMGWYEHRRRRRQLH